MPILPHQVFVALSALHDLVSEFFRIDAYTSSSGHLEGLRELAKDELLFFYFSSYFCSAREDLHYLFSSHKPS